MKQHFVRVLICPDKFKYSLSAKQICKIFTQQLPTDTYVCKSIPLADGGEGSLDAIQDTLKLHRVEIEVHDPLLRKIRTHYLFDNSSRTAYVEMAKASGLDLIGKNQRNPLLTSTIGTGQLIKHALQESKAKKMYMFIGGSATNDGGIGMASGLGVRFLDQKGNNLDPVGQSLSKIQQIKSQCLSDVLDGQEIIIASDVKNTLVGKEGATYVFGRQKGADENMLNQLQLGMLNYSSKLQVHFNKKIISQPGSGAAGGLGAAGIAYLNAKIEGGIDTVMKILNFSQHLSQSDVVITGQGKLDQQTLSGKVVHGVISQIDDTVNKKTYIFCGKSELPLSIFGSNVQIIPLMRQGMKEQFCIKNAEMLLREAIRQSDLMSRYKQL